MTQIFAKISGFWEKIKQVIFPALATKDQSLYQKINIIFGFFFLIPTFGLLYFIIEYNLFSEKYIPHFLGAFLICSLIGLILLRMVFEKIAKLSDRLTKSLKKDFESNGINKGLDEVENISKSFSLFEEHIKKTTTQLKDKVSEVSILKELSDLCYVTFDAEELLYIALERGLKITKADIGSILILEKTPKKHFVVKATIGVGEELSIGDTVDFQKSIAKYAVINKSPFIVEDIEKDTRLGRLNNSRYGSKSFVCMPIKTINEIIGVMTLSRKKSPQIFTSEDVEGLIPLVSNAAFTYENLRLVREIEDSSKEQEIITQLINTVNSSLTDTELYQTLLKNVLNIIPANGAVLMTKDMYNSNSVVVEDFYSKNQTDIQKGKSYSYKGSLLEKIFAQKNTILIEDFNSELDSEVDNLLLSSHGGNGAMIHPIINSGKMTGCLAFIMKTYGDVLQYNELTKIINNTFSLAVEKSLLSLSASRKTSELESIKQIGSVLASSTFEIEQVLRYTMEMIRVTMSVEAGSLYLIENDLLKVKTSFNIDFKKIFDFTLKLGQGIAGYVAANGNCTIENDIQASAMFYSGIDKASGFKTKSALCVPMISQGRVIGVIQVLNKINGNFGDDDQQLLQSIASSVSIAVENSRLYNETLFIAEKERGIRQIFQKFVPEEIVNKIVHNEKGAQNLMEELKTITLLNIDLRNFSVLANKIGPQKTVFALNHFFSVMGEIIFSHKGVVDKYLGDGFLALFGAPIATISDADNAISAALEMQQALNDINIYLKEKIDIRLKIGISIHTGEVVVGNIGFDKKMEYTVIGDAVNSIFAIQELTKIKSNTILISEKTVKAVRYPVKADEINVSNKSSKINGLKIFNLVSQNRSEPDSIPEG